MWEKNLEKKAADTKDYSPNSLPPWGFPHGVLLAPGHMPDTIRDLKETSKSECPLTGQTRYFLEKLSTEELGPVLQLWKDGWEQMMSYYSAERTPNPLWPYHGKPSPNSCKPTGSKKQNKVQDTYEAQSAAKETLMDGIADVTDHADPKGHYLFRTYWGQGNE